MKALLEVRDLSVEFHLSRRRTLTAVRDVSFDIGAGETFALIGESGSGKTTTARAILGLTEAASGTITFNGARIGGKRRRGSLEVRRQVSAVLQDPHEALNPRRRVLQSVMEPMEVHRIGNKGSRRQRALELLERVGLHPDHSARFPHQLSGGQKQRVNIARALTTEPSLLVCDEPVSALDVSIQAEILNLLADLRDERGIACLFISHDLGVVSHMADRVAVMYLGEIVELADVDALTERPQHPYSRALLAAQPLPLPSWSRGPRVEPLEGEIPSPLDPPSGCRFRTRCPHAWDRCATEAPLRTVIDGEQWVRCHLADEGRPVEAVSSGSTLLADVEPERASVVHRGAPGAAHPRTIGEPQ